MDRALLFAEQEGLEITSPTLGRGTDKHYLADFNTGAIVSKLPPQR